MNTKSGQIWADSIRQTWLKDVQPYVTLDADQDIEPLLDTVLSCGKFLVCSGCSQPDGHHYGNAGLIEHTNEVIDYSICLGKRHNKRHANSPVNLMDLFFSALYHDYGKIYDYKKGLTPGSGVCTSWQKTRHYTEIRHISTSFAIWENVAHFARYKNIEEVSHAILAHYMLPELGSPVAPQTDIAWILHLSDNMSAKTFKNY